MSDRNSHGRGASFVSWLLMFLCVAIVSAQQANDNATSKPSASSTITGRVINESGQPLPGVGVFVGALGTGGRRQTATDNEGYFKADGLDAGIYRIIARAPSYVSETPPPWETNEREIYYRPGDSVTIKLIKGGVIQGTITNAAGEALVNIMVRAIRIRDAEGKPLLAPTSGGEKLTDDRGYYRLYGLQPGSYVVSAGGQSQFVMGYAANPYGNDVPIFAPASTRDTAAEFVIRSGEEATADIRYRGESGHSISGHITGTQPNPTFIPSVSIADAATHTFIASANAMDENRGFQVSGLADGDYEITARAGGGPNGDLSASATKRVSVKGTDVTGIELALLPLASISGHINFELDSKLNCGRHRESALRETLIGARRDRNEPNAKDKSSQSGEFLRITPLFSETVANEKNEISLRNLESGTYRLEARLPGAGWYVRTINLGEEPKTAAGKNAQPNIARDGIKLKSGDKISGVSITVSEGGANLRGRVSTSEGKQLPENLNVFLVPSEHEAADNVLMFFETRVQSDGTFAIGNIAPGRYWMMARPSEGADATKQRSIREDSNLRTKVLREAEASKKEISFKPCERIADYELPFAAVSPIKQ